MSKSIMDVVGAERKQARADFISACRKNESPEKLLTLARAAGVEVAEADRIRAVVAEVQGLLPTADKVPAARKAHAKAESEQTKAAAEAAEMEERAERLRSNADEQLAQARAVLIEAEVAEQRLIRLHHAHPEILPEKQLPKAAIESLRSERQEQASAATARNQRAHAEAVARAEAAVTRAEEQLAEAKRNSWTGDYEDREGEVASAKKQLSRVKAAKPEEVMP